MQGPPPKPYPFTNPSHSPSSLATTISLPKPYSVLTVSSPFTSFLAHLSITVRLQVTVRYSLS
jgi:hypothetical protein